MLTNSQRRVYEVIQSLQWKSPEYYVDVPAKVLTVQAGMSLRNFRYCVDALKEAGLLRVYRGKGGDATYQVVQLKAHPNEKTEVSRPYDVHRGEPESSGGMWFDSGVTPEEWAPYVNVDEDGIMTPKDELLHANRLDSRTLNQKSPRVQNQECRSAENCTSTTENTGNIEVQRIALLGGVKHGSSNTLLVSNTDTAEKSPKKGRKSPKWARDLDPGIVPDADYVAVPVVKPEDLRTAIGELNRLSAYNAVKVAEYFRDQDALEG